MKLQPCSILTKANVDFSISPTISIISLLFKSYGSRISSWMSYGNVGVELFFMRSGFVIFWTLNRIERPLDFIVSRFSRLYPVYWAAVLITFISVFIFELPGRDVTDSEALLNLLMFQEYLYIPHVDGVYWTLTVEITFYFWMFILYLCNGLSRVEWFSLSLILLSLSELLGVISIPELVSKLLILKYIFFFASGISFYNIVNNKGSLVSYLVLACSLLATFFSFSLIHFLIFSLIYVVFYLSLTGRLQILAAKPFLFLGSISYTLYLVHQNIGYIVINKSYELSLNPLLGILMAILLSFSIAVCLTKYIEKPSLKIIRNGYKKNLWLQSKSTLFKKNR